MGFFSVVCGGARYALPLWFCLVHLPDCGRTEMRTPPPQVCPVWGGAVRCYAGLRGSVRVDAAVDGGKSVVVGKWGGRDRVVACSPRV
eukprot:gene5833-37463_t